MATVSCPGFFVPGSRCTAVNALGDNRAAASVRAAGLQQAHNPRALLDGQRWSIGNEGADVVLDPRSVEVSACVRSFGGFGSMFAGRAAELGIAEGDRVAW